MDVRQLADGLWRWTAGEAACVYYEAPDAVVLFDPLLPAAEEESFLVYLDRDVDRLGLAVSILLTNPQDERSASFLRERYAATDRIPESVEAYPVDGGRVAYFIRPHRALVVRAPDVSSIDVSEVELVLASSPGPGPVPGGPGSSGR